MKQAQSPLAVKLSTTRSDAGSKNHSFYLLGHVKIVKTLNALRECVFKVNFHDL
jgi:hypothetical protein